MPPIDADPRKSGARSSRCDFRKASNTFSAASSTSKTCRNVGHYHVLGRLGLRGVEFSGNHGCRRLPPPARLVRRSVIRAGVEKQRQAVAARKNDRLALGLHAAACMKDPQSAGVLKIVGHYAVPVEPVGVGDGCRAGLAGRETQPAGERADTLAVFRCAVMEDQDLVRPAGERLAGEEDMVLGEPGAVDAGGDVQAAAVVGRHLCLGMVFKGHHQVAEVPIAAESVIAAIVVPVPVVVAGPEGILVELDVFDACAAEEHRAQAAVADGQGLARPSLGRLGVPQEAMLVLPARAGRGSCLRRGRGGNEAVEKR